MYIKRNNTPKFYYTSIRNVTCKNELFTTFECELDLDHRRNKCTYYKITKYSKHFQLLHKIVRQNLLLYWMKHMLLLFKNERDAQIKFLSTYRLENTKKIAKNVFF